MRSAAVLNTGRVVAHVCGDPVEPVADQQRVACRHVQVQPGHAVACRFELDPALGAGALVTFRERFRLR